MYKALYRKYRPLTFDDVVAQPHITQTLLNQLVNNKTAHAYLFTGSRGTGKTTCARIFAKAINCEHPINGNPCLKCDICRDADEGALSDIIEIDAASNNGIDDVRDLREGALYTPERCKYKVYIIDEVHMLSKDAFNALLKIMEEPPPHVKFILATTEIHKVLPTILSRCQRFDFHRIQPADIKKRLLYVAEKENIRLDDTAAELIAKTADGGMRDALSLLDQCIAFSEDVTEEVVANAAGIAGREYLFEIIDAVIGYDPSKAIAVIQKLYELSKDMQKLCDELIAQFRNIMMTKTVPQNTELLACMPSEIELIKKYAETLTIDEIFDKLNLLQDCNLRLSRVAAKRVEIEMCMIKLCSAPVSSNTAIDNSEIYAKIDMLEQKIAQGIPAAPAPSYSRPTEIHRTTPAAPLNAASKTEQPQQQTDLAKLNPADFKPVEQWAEILEAFAVSCPPVSGSLAGSYALENQGYMLICTENSFFMNLLRNKENAAKLKESIRKITGKTYQIRAKCTAKAENEAAAGGNDPLQAILKKAEENGIPTECEN